jgi:D-tyrosyl-tRNA(Tyr) deacylase
MKSILLTFCCNLEHDPVSAHVLEQFLALHEFREMDISIDGKPVLFIESGGANYYVLRLDSVLSHAYERYAPLINEHFGNADALIIINWHEGAKAPDSIFTVQTTGDMKSGVFSSVDPRITRGLYLAVESERVRAGLDSFSTWMEATHWSGVIYGKQPGESVGKIIPSVIDLEIGSRTEDWSNPAAAKVLARALTRICDTWDLPVRSLFCLGGIHFESGFTQLIRDGGQRHGVAVSHILPNHWLVSEGYDDADRFEDLLRCARSIKGGIDSIVFHDNLKGAFKEQARRLGELLGVPVVSHKRMRSILQEQEAQ